jgi:outer membrane protein, heavy metal efflux system
MRDLTRLSLRIFVIILFCNNVLLSYGEEVLLSELNEKSTLQDYISFALQNNPDLKSYQNKWKAAKERIPQAQALPDPEISYVYLSQENPNSPEAQRQDFGIMQQFPWFGKLKLMGDIESRNANAEYSRLENMKLETIYKVKNTYYELFFINKNISVLEYNIKLLEYIEGISQTRFKSGSMLFDVLKIQIEKSKLEEMLKSSIEQKEPLTANFNALLNRDLKSSINISENIPEETIDISEKELIDFITDSNPLLKASDQEIASAKSKTLLEKKNIFPDLNIGIEYMDMYEDDKDSIQATIKLNIPLWGKKNSSSRAEANYMLIDSKEMKNSQFITLTTNLKEAIFEYKDALRKLDLYKNDLIPKTEHWLNIAEIAYQTGTIDITDLIGVQTNLLDFSISLERAYVDLVIATSRIEMLVGKEIPKLKNNNITERKNTLEN